MDPRRSELSHASRRAAFRLLMFTLLVFALTDQVTAAGAWAGVSGGAVVLALVGLVTCWVRHGCLGVPRGSPRDASGGKMAWEDK